MLRGKIKKATVPKISEINTKRMRKLHDLYGCARYTDIQIAYFYILWKGNHTQAALDLGCVPMTMWIRVHQLSKSAVPGLASKFNGQKLRQVRSDAKVSNEDFILVIKTAKSIRQAARILGIHHNAVRMRALHLGVKLNKGKPGRKKKK